MIWAPLRDKGERKTRRTRDESEVFRFLEEVFWIRNGACLETLSFWFYSRIISISDIVKIMPKFEGYTSSVCVAFLTVLEGRMRDLLSTWQSWHVLRTCLPPVRLLLKTGRLAPTSSPMKGHSKTTFTRYFTPDVISFYIQSTFFKFLEMEASKMRLVKKPWFKNDVSRFFGGRATLLG